MFLPWQTEETDERADEEPREEDDVANVIDGGVDGRPPRPGKKAERNESVTEKL